MNLSDLKVGESYRYAVSGATYACAYVGTQKAIMVSEHGNERAYTADVIARHFSPIPKPPRELTGMRDLPKVEGLVDRVDDAMNNVRAELLRAMTKHAPMHSHHEAYAVILEEMDEYWLEVRAQPSDYVARRKELIQTAAMCIRALVDLP